MQSQMEISMQQFYKRISSALLIGILSFQSWSVLASEAESARVIVETFQLALIETMKQGKELGYEGRFNKLAEPVKLSHDLTKIARIVVGREWENLTAEQQTQLVDVFSKLSISSYAHNFKDFDGESFVFDSEEQTARGGVIIHTTLIIPNDKNVKFDYMLKKKGNSWKIINIIANGVSDLALKRSEYTSILKREGFDPLITKINEKIDNYSKQ
ncbi:ABC transporter substrate-binding protein [Methylicorpusculum oleiharenae]|uniref:ABC transporter substrate-binding protein n=1 Tax=Methylicorpusculum oleiharenae TaxID=1338687 RepID=UPI001E2903A7|nr:ABC transporter substrate-binding protein [Methylicorpusculum oleiharenae]MCD2451321.1 ABC transporter substrate-binding protein [Methylicorpusculum oleiharenae]